MLMNYIALEEGVPVRLHFTDHYIIEREIWDKDAGRMKTLRSLTFFCDKVDGTPAAKTFSILADKLAGLLQPYLPDNEYRTKEFIITKQGEGFVKRFSVQVIPFQG